MSAVDKVQVLMAGESHVRHEESKQWCVTYREALMQLAVEVDLLRAENFALKHANPERWQSQVASLLKQPPEQLKLSKSEATSIRMRKYWAEKKAKRT